MRLLIAAALVMFCANTASAADVWLCTYPGYNEPHAPIIVRFHQDGGFMVDSWVIGDRKYRILQNTQSVLIAAWSFSNTGSAQEPSFGSAIITINKITGAFVYAPTGQMPAMGSCIKGRPSD
jgi:hypothetical protein